MKKRPEGMPPDAKRWEDDGQPIVVLRPQDPGRTVSLAMDALRRQDEGLYRRAAAGDNGPCVFLGYLARRKGRDVIVFEGSEDKPFEPGDIITSPDHLSVQN